MVLFSALGPPHTPRRKKKWQDFVRIGRLPPKYTVVSHALSPLKPLMGEVIAHQDDHLTPGREVISWRWCIEIWKFCKYKAQRDFDNGSELQQHDTSSGLFSVLRWKKLPGLFLWLLHSPEKTVSATTHYLCAYSFSRKKMLCCFFYILLHLWLLYFLICGASGSIFLNRCLFFLSFHVSFSLCFSLSSTCTHACTHPWEIEVIAKM